MREMADKLKNDIADAILKRANELVKNNSSNAQVNNNCIRLKFGQHDFNVDDNNNGLPDKYILVYKSGRVEIVKSNDRTVNLRDVSIDKQLIVLEIIEDLN